MLLRFAVCLAAAHASSEDFAEHALGSLSLSSAASLSKLHPQQRAAIETLQRNANARDAASRSASASTSASTSASVSAVASARASISRSTDDMALLFDEWRRSNAPLIAVPSTEALALLEHFDVRVVDGGRTTVFVARDETTQAAVIVRAPSSMLQGEEFGARELVLFFSVERDGSIRVRIVDALMIENADITSVLLPVRGAAHVPGLDVDVSGSRVKLLLDARAVTAPLGCREALNDHARCNEAFAAGATRETIGNGIIFSGGLRVQLPLRNMTLIDIPAIFLPRNYISDREL